MRWYLPRPPARQGPGRLSASEARPTGREERGEAGRRAAGGAAGGALGSHRCTAASWDDVLGNNRDAACPISTG